MTRKPHDEDMEQRVRQIEEALSRSRRSEEALQIEKAYLEHLLDCAPEAIALADRNHRITRTNVQFTRLFGYTPEETMGLICDDLIAPGDKAGEASDITRQVGQGEAVRIETVRYRKDGSPVFVELMAAPVRVGDEYVGGYASYRDITDRKRAEEVIWEREEEARRLAQENAIMAEIGRIIGSTLVIDEVYELFSREVRKLIAFDRIGINVVNAEKGMGVLTYVAGEGIPNRAPGIPYPLEGTAIAEMIRTRSTILVQTDDLNEVKSRFPRLLSTFQAGFRSAMNVPLIAKGKIIGALLLRSIQPDAYGAKDLQTAERVGRQIAGAIANAQLYVERKRAEDALRTSEARFRSLAEGSPFGISFMRGDSAFEFFNRKFTEILGYTKEDLPDQRTWFEKAYPDRAYRERVISVWNSDSAGGRATGEVKPEVFTVRCKDGQDKIIHFRAVTAEDGGQFLTYEDITSQVNAQNALRESEEKYRLLVQNANDAIFIAQDNVLKFANPMTERLTGYSAGELSETPFIRLVHPQDKETVRENYERRLKGEPVPTYSFRIISREGRELRVQLNGVAITWEGRPASLNFVRDITEQTKLEAQFQASQRLESLGTLAGGIAHDFNNILMGIQGRASLMLLDTDSSHPDFELLKGIEEHVKSAADLTKQLLGFARGGKYEVKPSDLNELMKKTSAMFGRTKKEIRIHEKVQDGIWIVEIDQGQIQQVLMNLYVNAWQAMPGGGDLYLETGNVVLDEAYGKGFSLRPGNYVRISVTDTGVGMDEKTKARLFEPFFTTKEMGRGTGLGLASSYGIIKNHGGIITVYSEKGVGSSFHIYLPASNKELVETKEWDADLLEGHETVLLVDDEEHVLDIGKQMLERLGYQVLTASGGAKAVEAFETCSNRIDLVVLDMVMPDMGGGETFDRLKQISPDIKVLLSSGYSMNAQAQTILDRGCHGFIQKPFNMIELSHKVRESLDKPPVS